DNRDQRGLGHAYLPGLVCVLLRPMPSSGKSITRCGKAATIRWYRDHRFKGRARLGTIGLLQFHQLRRPAMLGEVFERFVEKSPISVMVRASLERVLGADRLDLWYERTARKQYTRDLLFSSIYDMMNQVVFCVQPSVRAAYQAQQDDIATSLVSVYNKLN